MYHLKYCQIRKQFVFDIPRNLIKKFCYKFFFVINGVKTIDQNYHFIRVKNDYVNIINFKKIQDKEYYLENEYDKEIEEYFCSNLSSETTSKTSRSSINSLEYSQKINHDFENILDLGLRKFNYQKKNINYPIKSILKCRNYRRKKSINKVNFGNIDFLI